MCSKHAHVQSIVSRLNAGEHIAEVQLRGPSAYEPLLCPVCKSPPACSPFAGAARRGTLRRVYAWLALVHRHQLRAAGSCSALPSVLVRLQGQSHSRTRPQRQGLCTSHTVANREGADAVGMRNTGSLIGKTGIVDVVKPLKENTHVRHVDLASNGLNEFGATQMAQVCPRRCGDPTRSVHSGQCCKTAMVKLAQLAGVEAVEWPAVAVAGRQFHQELRRRGVSQVPAGQHQPPYTPSQVQILKSTLYSASV